MAGTKGAFDLQPTLTSERLELRPLRAEDFEALYAVARDPLIWELHPAKTRYKRPVFKAFFAAALKSGGAFAILERGSGATTTWTRLSVKWRSASRFWSGACGAAASTAS